MQYFPAALQELADQFARLPGIGGKSAQRLAFHVLGLPEDEAAEFAEAILNAKRNVTCCPACQNFTAGGGTGISVQPIGILCVSKDGDVELINIGVKNPSDPLEQLSDLIDRSPEIIAKIKALFAKKN